MLICPVYLEAPSISVRVLGRELKKRCALGEEVRLPCSPHCLGENLVQIKIRMGWECFY